MRLTTGFVVLLCWLSCVCAWTANDGCIFVNTTLGVSYNITSLHSNTNDLEGSTDLYFYYLNPCSRVLNPPCLLENPNAAVCQKDLSTGNMTWTALAEYRNETQPNRHITDIWNRTDIGAGLVFTYNNAPCNASANYTTRVIFACNRTIGNTSLSVTTPDTCRVDIKVSSPVACGVVFGPSSSSSFSSTGGLVNSSSSSGAYNMSSSSSSSSGTNTSSTASGSSSTNSNSTGGWSSTGSGPASSSSSSGPVPSSSRIPNGSSSSSSTGSPASTDDSPHHGFTAFGFGVGVVTGLGVAALVAVLYCCCKRKRNPYSINGTRQNALLDDDFQ